MHFPRVVQLLSPGPVLPLNAEFPESEIHSSTQVPGGCQTLSEDLDRKPTNSLKTSVLGNDKNTARTYLDYSPRQTCTHLSIKMFKNQGRTAKAHKSEVNVQELRSR